MQEIVQKRGRKSKTFDLGGGRFRTEIGNHSHTNKSGLWLPTNTGIVGESGLDADTGLNYISRSLFENLDYDIRFGKNDPVWMKIKHIPTGKKVTFKPKNNNNRPEHTLVGNKIFVSQAWDGIDMEIFVNDCGTKTNYIITSGAGQRVVEFAVNGDLPFAKISRAFYTGDHPADVRYIPTSFSNGTLAMDFRNVPIGTVVDPTVTIQPDETAAKDVLIRMDDPNGNQDAATSYLGVGDVSSGVTATVRTLFKFDLSGITGTVNSATIGLYNWLSERNGGPTSNDITLHKVLRDWSETQATWNSYTTGNSWGTAGATNATDSDATAFATITKNVSTYNAFFEWDAQSFVQDIVDGTPNYGFLLRCLGNEALGVYYSYYLMRGSYYATSSQRPKITVDYTEASSAYSGVIYFMPFGGPTIY